jgi:ABC-2 type transport system ATP-binding protein
MEQVEEICDHIVLVNQGKKILDGGVAEVKQSFKENIFKIQLSGEPAFFDDNIFQVIKKDGLKLTLKIQEQSTSNDVLKYFIDQQVLVEGFNEILPSLNDIFINLVEGTKAARQFEHVA